MIEADVLALVKDVHHDGVKRERHVERVGSLDERLVVQVSALRQLENVDRRVEEKHNAVEDARAVASRTAGQFRFERQAAQRLGRSKQVG